MPLPPPRVIESIFLQYGTLKNYPANKTIFVKGDVTDKIAFIKSGQVRAVVTNPAGDETTLFYMGKGNIFGSDSLVPNPVVVVNVETITPCELYMLPAKQFLEIWHKHNFPIQELLAHYLKRISLLSDYICCSHFTNAKQRVAYFLHFRFIFLIKTDFIWYKKRRFLLRENAF